MNLPVRSRRKPRSKIGMLIVHWPKIRLGLQVMRLARRYRIAIRVGLVAAAAFAVRTVVRRRRASAAPAPTYSPPTEVKSTPAGGGTRETGYEAGPGTATERNLEAEKR